MRAFGVVAIVALGACELVDPLDHISDGVRSDAGSSSSSSSSSSSGGSASSSSSSSSSSSGAPVPFTCTGKSEQEPNDTDAQDWDTGTTCGQLSSVHDVDKLEVAVGANSINITVTSEVDIDVAIRGDLSPLVTTTSNKGTIAYPITDSGDIITMTLSSKTITGPVKWKAVRDGF